MRTALHRTRLQLVPRCHRDAVRMAPVPRGGRPGYLPAASRSSPMRPSRPFHGLSAMSTASQIAHGSLSSSSPATPSHRSGAASCRTSLIRRPTPPDRHTVDGATARPPAEKVSDQTTINWRRLNVFSDLGRPWYKNVVLWWAVFLAGTAGVMFAFSKWSGLFSGR